MATKAKGKMARTAEILRKTKETKVKVSLDLDGSGKTTTKTGVGFFDHMLELLGRHSLIDLSADAEGDLQVDSHHTVEDVGIVLGQALAPVQVAGGVIGIAAIAVVARLRRVPTESPVE